MKGKGEGARKQKKEKENCQNDKKTLDEKIFLLYNNRACLRQLMAKSRHALVGENDDGRENNDKSCAL